VRQLSDILIEKVKAVGGKTALAGYLGVTDGAIHQYIGGSMPSLSVAIAWKKSFNENLIDLMFTDKPTVVAEPEVKYNEEKELIKVREKEQAQRELAELKNFGRDVERKSKLKK
jgi:hypothetical protein